MHTVKLVKKFHFEAAHRLVNAPQGHKCRNLHGHSFKFEIEVKGKVDSKRGWFMDYKDISRIAKPVVEELDHSYLNDIPGLENGTSENLAKWIWEKIDNKIKGLHRVSVYETASSECHYYGTKKQV